MTVQRIKNELSDKAGAIFFFGCVVAFLTGAFIQSGNTVTSTHSADTALVTACERRILPYRTFITYEYDLFHPIIDGTRDYTKTARVAGIGCETLVGETITIHYRERKPYDHMIAGNQFPLSPLRIWGFRLLGFFGTVAFLVLIVIFDKQTTKSDVKTNQQSSA